MVGVAGRSKGCATCRKRKIKCDEAKPVCGRCLRSGIQCERYARYPVFINRGQAGYTKRIPLEEVRPYMSASMSIHSPGANSVRLVNWFRETFLNVSHSQVDLRPPQYWLALAAAQTSPHPALNMVVIAISFCRWSRVEDNPMLKQNGRAAYQKSLCLIQKALTDTEQVVSDDILAATCAMILYELFDPSSRSLDSWVSHMSGIETLLCLRGPGNFSDATSRAILEHVRCLSMIRHLNSRTQCVFGYAPWLQLPWLGVCKPLEQQVFDQGLVLTTLFPQFDQLNLGRPLISSIRIFLQACAGMFASLVRLDARISFATNLVCDTDSALCIVSEDTLALMLLSITALGIELEAATLAGELLSIRAVRTLESAEFAEPIPEMISPEIQALCDQRLPLARRILQLTKFRIRFKIGGLGAVRIIWSLQTAMRHFGQTDVEFEQCKMILAHLSQNTGPFNVLRNLLHVNPRPRILLSSDGI